MWIVAWIVAIGIVCCANWFYQEWRKKASAKREDWCGENYGAQRW